MRRLKKLNSKMVSAFRGISSKRLENILKKGYFDGPRVYMSFDWENSGCYAEQNEDVDYKTCYPVVCEIMVDLKNDPLLSDEDTVLEYLYENEDIEQELIKECIKDGLLSEDTKELSLINITPEIMSKLDFGDVLTTVYNNGGIANIVYDGNLSIDRLKAVDVFKDQNMLDYVTINPSIEKLKETIDKFNSEK